MLRFGAATLNNAAPEADTVIGQKDFTSGFQDRGGAVSASGFDMPTGLAFDAQDNLYVSDYNNTRVLRFPAPLGPSTANPAANAVWGEADFATRAFRGRPPVRAWRARRESRSTRPAICMWRRRMTTACWFFQLEHAGRGGERPRAVEISASTTANADAVPPRFGQALCGADRCQSRPVRKHRGGGFRE